MINDLGQEFRVRRLAYPILDEKWLSYPTRTIHPAYVRKLTAEPGLDPRDDMNHASL